MPQPPMPFGFALPEQFRGQTLSTYQPTFREMATDYLRQMMFSDDREGQRKAERVSNVLETTTPFGFATGIDDAKNAFEQGDYATGSALSLAVVPFAAAARTPIKRAAMELDDNLARAVANTKSAKLVDEGLAVTVTRNQRPEQGRMDSVRGGVFYLPEGSKDQKFYSGSGFNSNYGGTEKIRGETLFKNPLVAKGATGGKAPESAFDSLMGKGAYQKMRSDALQSVPPYYFKDEGLKTEMVSKFLEKYAPEMADKAYYILQNSAKGNQLAYALQEAAVASAVRRAGHDGVLGYSVSSKTKEPFLSEVFDVREDAYPDKFGGYSMWPEFNPPPQKEQP